MTRIEELFNFSALLEELANGNVRERVHPDFPELRILNYTEQAAFNRHWNPVTIACRGLIFNAETREVLARPFPKFHNWDEQEAPPIAWDQKLYHWSNKEDGSLGILYRDPNGRPAIATRGSFESDQAIHATELLHDAGMAYVYDEYIDSGYTPLFEIVYPENRIVLNYGDRDALIPLGYIHVATGAFVPPIGAKQRTFADLQRDLSRSNAEGWVAWVSAYKAVKIKQADYVELHRIITGLNRKSVWRALMTGTIDKLKESLPDELYQWAEDVEYELVTQHNRIYWDIAEFTNLVLAAVGRDVTQKEIAAEVQRTVPKDKQGLVFADLARKPITDKIWRMIEPVGGER